MEYGRDGLRWPSSPSSSSSLPLPVNSKTCMSAAAKRWRYLRRLLHFRQMDFEFAFWQMVYLLWAPKQVYKNFMYRKKTKSQFARDDPAFLVLLAGWLVVTSLSFVLALGGVRPLAFVQFLFYVIFVDCIGVGVAVATCLWALTNRFMVRPSCRDQDVEWAYCFDVHLNAFFPLLVILHFVQLFFYKVLISRSDWFLATLFGNTLWLVALGYYFYITFLGYSSVPILQKTRLFLCPMLLLIIFYVLSLAFNFNMSISLFTFYHNRVI